ncbi:MAG: hypothetical protein ACRBN8_10830 [Nannocystales bacterium]
MQNQPPYTPGGPLSTGHYEFSDEENEQISQTGARARLWGLISLITGVLALVGLIVSLVFKDELILHGLDPSYVTIFVVSLVPIVLTHLVISMLYVGAGKSLEAVVATEGNDIEHLMQSLDKLGTAFLVEFVIGFLAIIVSVGAGVQMAVANVDAQKAADAARAEAENERLAEAAEADDEEGDTDDSDDADADADADADEGDEDEGDDAEEGADEDEEADGDTDDADGDTDGEDGEEGDDAEEGEDAEEGDDEPAEDAAAPTEDPTAG